MRSGSPVDPAVRAMIIRPLRKRAFGLLADASGAAGVEFAIVGPIFIGFVLAFFELGMVMLRISSVDFAVAEASKFVYIGAATAGDPTQSDIEDFICSRALLVSNCKQNIAVELTVVEAFFTPPPEAAPCRDSSSVDPAPVVRYQPGGTSDIVFMRVCVTTDVLTPFLGLGASLHRTETNRLQIVSSIAFMNEPF
jgi:Flp pilus assembly protein TadG